MDSKLSLKTEVTSKQLLDAIKDIHTMSMSVISEIFCVTYKFYDKDNLIYHILNKYTPEDIVCIVKIWRSQRTFNKDDIVMNFASRNYFIVTYVDEYSIHLIGVDGRTSKHNIAGFEKWYTRTNNQIGITQFLSQTLQNSEG